MKITIILGLVIAATTLLAQAPPSVPPDPAAGARAKADRGSKQDCTRSCFEASSEIVEAANGQFSQGNVELGQKWMKDAIEYARKGTQAAIDTRKHQKEAEITLRKLSKRIHDIGDSLALDDRPPVYEESKAIDTLRDEMLTAMFGTPKKTLEDDRKKKP